MLLLHFSKSSLELKSSLADSAIMICGCDCMLMIVTTRSVLCAIKFVRAPLHRDSDCGHVFVRRSLTGILSGTEISTHSQLGNKWKSQEICQDNRTTTDGLCLRRKSELKYSSLRKRIRSRLTFQLESSIGCEKKFFRKRRNFCVVHLVLEIWTWECCCIRQLVGVLTFWCLPKKTRDLRLHLGRCRVMQLSVTLTSFRDNVFWTSEFWELPG